MCECASVLVWVCEMNIERKESCCSSSLLSPALVYICVRARVCVIVSVCLRNFGVVQGFAVRCSV